MINRFEYANESTERLLEFIGNGRPGIPVRAMEEVLRRRGEAVDATIAEFERRVRLLADAPDDESLERERSSIQWLAVLLGEMRAPDAVDPLLRAFRAGPLGPDRFPITDALAKIGAPALDAVIELARSRSRYDRVWMYAVLGRMDDDRARSFLLEALETDAEGAISIGFALEEQSMDASIAVPRLFQALQRCPWWQTGFVQDSIRALHRGKLSLVNAAMRALYGGNRNKRGIEIDWRIRYQPRLPWGEADSGWPPVVQAAHMAYQLDPRPGPNVKPPPDSLDEILAQPEPREVCDCCGVPQWYATGLHVCPHQAAAIAAIQFHWINDRISQGIEDIFDALDVVLSDIVEHSETLGGRGQLIPGLGIDLGEPEPDEADEIEQISNVLLACQGVCNWLIEQGIEDVGAGRARLLLEMVDLGIAHGDPNDIVNPLLSLEGVEAPTVGVEPASATRGESGGASVTGPAVVTFEGDPLAFCRAHFKVSEIGAVLRSLEGDRRFGVGPVIGSFAWADRERDDMPMLGHVQVSGDRMTLECLSEPRLERGKAILDDLVGAWISHERDTSVKLEDIRGVKA